MLFPTIDFAIFFAIAFTVNWLLNPYSGWWKLSMIGLSYVFYGWGGWRFWLAPPAHAVGCGRPFPPRQAGLPIAIAFFPSMATSYVVHIYRRELEPAKPLD